MLLLSFFITYLNVVINGITFVAVVIDWWYGRELYRVHGFGLSEVGSADGGKSHRIVEKMIRDNR